MAASHCCIRLKRALSRKVGGITFCCTTNGTFKEIVLLFHHHLGCFLSRRRLLVKSILVRVCARLVSRLFSNREEARNKEKKRVGESNPRASSPAPPAPQLVKKHAFTPIGYFPL